MKPLSSFVYIKGNPRKVLPSFICTIISVFLIYLFGLLLYGSVNDFYKLYVNDVSKGTFIYSNNINKPIDDKIADEIKNDSNVSDTMPFLGMNNSFGYKAVFGGVTTQSVNLFSEDVPKFLNIMNAKLVSGTMPENNADEMLLPIELAKQYKLKAGDYINIDTNPDIHVDKTYKLVGITSGDIWVPIVCDTGKTKREDAEKFGMIFFFKDSKNMKLNDSLTALKDKNLVIQDYKSVKESMDQLAGSINFLYVSLDIIILIVLCISLGNLNYIVFMNRKNEFSILKTIGFSTSKLRRKMFIENTIVCFFGFVVGIAATILTTELLNIAVWHPAGQNIPVFRLDSLLVALIIPAVVSLISILSSVREFNKLSYETLN